MNRNILNIRPKTSHQNSSPRPAKMAVFKAALLTPSPLDLMVHGNQIESKEFSSKDDSQKIEKVLTFETFHGIRKRPHSAHVDKHVLKSLTRSPSVENSFYDKFERLDRDSVVGDTAFKEKTVQKRVKSAGVSTKQRSTLARIRIPSRLVKSKRRSKSASAAVRNRARDTIKSSEATNYHAKEKERPKSANAVLRKSLRQTSTGSFFETAMSFDDETKQNTLTNAVRQISPRTVLKGNHKDRSRAQTKQVKNCPTPRSKPRERSPSCQRSSRRDSIGTRSTGSESVCSSRSSRRSKRLPRRLKSRKSRSRTRRETPHPTFCTFGSSSKKSLNAVNHKRDTDTMIQKVVRETIKAIPNDEVVSAPMKRDTGSFAYSYNHVRPKSNKKSSSTKTAAAPIEAVQKANKIAESKHLNIMNDMSVNVIPIRRPLRVSSTVPRLKMIVAPTATPIASYIRTAGAHMLMNH